MHKSINVYNTSPTIDYYLPLHYYSIIVNIKNIEEQSDSESRRFLFYYPRDRLLILASLIGPPFISVATTFRIFWYD